MIFRRLALMLVVALLTSAHCFATGTLALTWGASNFVGLGGYRVYEGLASQNYTVVKDVGTATTATITGLLPGTTYYFTVTDYDLTGAESSFAPEISFTVPPSATLSITLNQSGQAVLSGIAPLGYTYDVQVCNAFPYSQPTSWTVIGSVTVDSNNSFNFTSPTIATNQSLFYRLRQSYP